MNVGLGKEPKRPISQEEQSQDIRKNVAVLRKATAAAGKGVTTVGAKDSPAVIALMGLDVEGSCTSVVTGDGYFTDNPFAASSRRGIPPSAKTATAEDEMSNSSLPDPKQEANQCFLGPDGKLWLGRKIGTPPANPTSRQIFLREDLRKKLFGPKEADKWKSGYVTYSSEEARYAKLPAVGSIQKSDLWLHAEENAFMSKESPTSEEEIVLISTEEILQESKGEEESVGKQVGATAAVRVNVGLRKEPKRPISQEEIPQEQSQDIRKNVALLKKATAAGGKGVTTVGAKDSPAVIALMGLDVEGSCTSVVTGNGYFTDNPFAASSRRGIPPSAKTATAEDEMSNASLPDLKQEERFQFSPEFIGWSRDTLEVLSADTDNWVKKLTELYTSMGYDGARVERELRRLIACLESEEECKERMRSEIESQRARNYKLTNVTPFTPPPVPEPYSTEQVYSNFEDTDYVEGEGAFFMDY